MFSRPRSVRDRIYSIIQDLAGSAKFVKMVDVIETCTNKGFKPSQVDETVDEYEELNVWQINQARTRITFV